MSSGMWTEKYRPQSLDEIVNQKEIVSRFKNFVNEKNMPHLLLVGPAGVGKTTSILAMARDLYGPSYRSFILELNASDERGIGVIRDKVKNFARTAAIASPVNFKILIMDEADHLTSDAQHALRRTMEIYTRTCRFCLLGNYSENIIDPIQSRCSVFRFSPLEEDALKGHVENIAKRENLDILEEGIDAIYQASNGDVRKSLNLLQAAAANKQTIDDVAIYNLLGNVSPEAIKNMLKTALDGNFLDSRELLRELLINQGVAPTDIIRNVYREIMRNSSLSERMKVKLSDTLGTIDYRLTQGSRAEIQLSTLLAHLSVVGEEKE
ncbi:replication factor C small subunit [Candidatus Bathyarchaeota archaeon]|jgi:replication factor C small subunit|nr:replication factor C small subunit [Candidatus Bathyarchaeota archaeon]MBT4319044.1 replication factor C small subunit [Candidatus Bathyarchaeota archaeon]MBT7185853.1 replication factor C small subunit [Candidatus Bathyarchaeota archaeon]MBT7346462.1 replication factor C small subunit [Candidatus Bathyarchaeota archaeon]